MLKSAANGRKITFRGTIPAQNEKLAPTIENNMVTHWLDAMVGADLLEHVFRTLMKDLETETLVDLRQHISESLEHLWKEAIQLATTNWIQVQSTPEKRKKNSPHGNATRDL